MPEQGSQFDFTVGTGVLDLPRLRKRALDTPLLVQRVVPALLEGVAKSSSRLVQTRKWYGIPCQAAPARIILFESWCVSEGALKYQFLAY